MARIINVTAVTGNYPDGQKIDRALVTYDCRLNANVPAAAFHVADRTITGIEVDGDTVTIFLNPREEAAGLIPKPPPRKLKPGEKAGGPPRDLPPAARRPVQITVTQKEPIGAADGGVIAPDGAIHVSNRAIEPIVEDFAQFEFNGIPYNLYTPRNLEPGRLYPLVLFIHDAGPCGPDPKITLSQGYGAIGFAEPSWQEKHPCFILAPQIDRHIHLTNDDFTCSKEIFDIKKMVDFVADSNPIDKNRIYATGQSMGCMASCELNILYPDYFAASLLVAGQWDPVRMGQYCSRNKFWILVSEKDAKAFPGMNAVTEALEANGAVVARYRWVGSAGADILTELAREAMKDNANVRYTVFVDSSVLPEGAEDNPGNNHIHTWPVVYPVVGLKEWLFTQRLR
ncbi:MAG TPA: hypothetical protein GXZ52_05465 [Clostridiales bacterium]|nr:hypothetical protein [Clostridiales bacterium]